MAEVGDFHKYLILEGGERRGKGKKRREGVNLTSNYAYDFNGKKKKEKEKGGKKGGSAPLS
ncbi:MAG: hypothetical protein U5K51_16870 [Flavobacteriaceae bacterium]|nr:hypothetical protein [Flavobacteriaceae bacterium]